MSGTPFASRLARALWLCLLFVATLEICTRLEAWWRWDAPFWGPYSSASLRTVDQIGARNRPGARFEKWEIDKAGFRGPELSLRKAPGVVRVGVTGASEVFGLYESPGKDLTAQLRSLLAAAAPGRFEVVNLASPGMTPPRICELFERWAARFDFDIVVVYPTPAFYLDLKPPPRKFKPTATPVVVRPGTFSLRLTGQLWAAGRRLLPARLQSWMKRALVERERLRHPPQWVWDVPPPERVALFAGDMRSLVQTLQDADVRVILATHAHPFSVPLRQGDLARMDGWIRFYPRATARCLLDMERQANEVVYEIGRERGLAVVDIQGALGKDPRNYADFSHFTDEGAAQAAAAFASEILKAVRPQHSVAAGR
jgi:hypothetical protein